MKHLRRKLFKYSMFIGELINSRSIYSQINIYTPLINCATQDLYKRTLIKAIIFEEQVHQFPFESFVERHLPLFIADYFKIVDSIGPGQIRASLWADKYETTRDELFNPEIHFTVMCKHLDFIFDITKERSLPVTPEWIGTLWSTLNAKKVNDFGYRVLKYYNKFENLV